MILARTGLAGRFLVVSLAAIVIGSGLGTLFFTQAYAPLFDMLLGGHGIAPVYVARFVETPSAFARSCLHILPGIVWMAIAPLQFSKLRRSSIQTHRRLGRVFLVCAVIAWVGMLGMLTMPFGEDRWEIIPNVMFGTLFLVSAGFAFWHIRNKRPLLHREWMIRHVSVGMGIALMRPVASVAWLAGWIGGSVEAAREFFPHLFWICFVLSVGTAEVWINLTRKPVGRPTPA